MTKYNMTNLIIRALAELNTLSQAGDLQPKRMIEQRSSVAWSQNRDLHTNIWSQPVLYRFIMSNFSFCRPKFQIYL